MALPERVRLPVVAPAERSCMDFGPGRGWCLGRLEGRRVRKRIPMWAEFQVDAVPRIQPAQSATLGWLHVSRRTGRAARDSGT